MISKARIKFLVFSIIPATALLAVFELASYFYYRHRVLDDFMPIDVSDSFHNIPDLFERRHTDQGDLLFSRYFPTRYYVSERDYRGKTMSATKGKRIFRIFSFGGSSTAGSPWGYEASFSRFLEDELNALKRADTTVEVVNFGGSGYGSTRALGLVKASIQYKPDLLVIYAGHNEMWDNYVYLDIANANLKVRLRTYGDHLYSVRVARFLLERTLAKPPERVDLLSENSMYIPPLLKDKKGFKAPERQYLTAQFGQNMRAIIAAARAANVQVLLVSEPSNFSYEPSWFPGEHDQVQEQWTTELRKQFDNHNLTAARSLANKIVEMNPENPIAHFYLGLLDRLSESPKTAREHFLEAIDFDERPERYTRPYRAIQIGLEDQQAGVYFIDAWKAAAKFLDDGIVDGRLIVDKMHPIVECNKMIAETIEDDFFVRHHVRADLFDYDKVDPKRIWNDNISPELYLKICERYFKISDPALCVPEMFKKYSTMPEGSAEKGIYQNCWEYLLYYGLLTHDRIWLDESASIYKARSLAGVRLQSWAATDAAH